MVQRRLCNRSLTAKTAILSAAVILAFLAAGPVAFYRGGARALAAAGLAATLCLAGAAVGLLAAYQVPERRLGLPNLWTAMAARMGIPLGIALVIHLQGGPLAEAGLLWYLLVFYPVTLAVGIALSLPERETTMLGGRDCLHALDARHARPRRFRRTENEEDH